MKKILGLIGLGAALKYFLDPETGAGRRATLQNRLTSMFRRSSSSQAQQELGEQVKELKEDLSPTDDVTLARKVESELFRDADVPKGQINVNAENGKVVLRGEVGQPEMIKDLEERARSVQGVSDVENLLHLPGTEAPMHE